MSAVLFLRSTPPGELPPPPPRACFGRDELIGKIIGLAENLAPIALIGAGGIGKTSIVLTVLHHDRIKERFGDNRWFIRCDQFPASSTSFLSRLAKVFGAGVENPPDLAPLRPFLSSREMVLVLDNAESILDPRGANAREIYAVVEELSQLSNICLCVTSRISIIPPACENLYIPTLSVEAAHDTFHYIYKNGVQSEMIDDILKQLDFHPLSITLLATVALHNGWDTGRLSKEWQRRRIDVLRTQHDTSLATTVELSLASPMFQELGPDARELLGVVAFFPQGIDENKLDWLFPAFPSRTNIFDNFCNLSLTYRSNGFITMLAPLRDYLCPRDPTSSPLLCTTKDHYFHRLSAHVNPGERGFEETRWIMSEDVNVEHLLDVFTFIDTDSAGAWDACSNFTRHLYCHKPQLVTLGPKIEGLPDDHPSKPQCLFWLSQLFGSAGNHVERKRLLFYSLDLWRGRGNDFQVAETLGSLSGANRSLGFHREAIKQAREAVEIYERLGNTTGQARSLQELAWSLYDDKQLDAAEEAASKAIRLPGKGDQFPVCECYRILGNVCHSRGEAEKAMNHFEAALRIASAFDWHHNLFWNHYCLAELFFDENRFDDAHAHVEQAKSYATNVLYRLGRAVELQARLWYKQRVFGDAKSEVLRAIDAYEKVGATKKVERCRALLRDIEEAVSRESDFNGETLETALLPTHINFPFSAQGTGQDPTSSPGREPHEPPAPHRD